MTEDFHFKTDFLIFMRSYGAVSSLSMNYSINYHSIVPLSTRVRDDDVEKKIKNIHKKLEIFAAARC